MCAKILDLDVRSRALPHNYATATSRAVRLCINDSDSANLIFEHTSLYAAITLLWLG